MVELQHPDMLGQFNQGYDRGQSQQASKLAGLAFSAQGGDRQAALSQLAGVDPRMAMGMADRFTAQDQAQAQQAKTQEVDHAQKINGAGRFMLQAVQSKDPAKIQGAWSAIAPYLAELTGKQPPAQWDDSMLPAMYQAIANSGGMPEQKGTVVAPGSALIDQATGKQMYANPAALQYRDVPMGEGKAAGVFNPSDGSIRPAAGGGMQPAASGGAQPSGDPMQPFIAQANQAVQLGADPDKVQAWLVQQAQGAGLQPQGPGAPSAGQPMEGAQTAAMGAPGQGGAQFGVGTPKTAAESALQQRIDLARKMGATDAQIKDMVVGGSGGAQDVPAPGDPTKAGDEYLATLPAGMQPLVKAIANGDQAPPSASSRSPQAQALLQAVYAYDPTASAGNLPTRTATRKSFTSGKDAQNMTALSQLALHLDHLNGQVDTVAGYAAPNFVNGAINSVADKSNGKTTAFESSANAVAHELRVVFSNASGGTQAELEENLKQLNSSNSVAQKRAAVQNIAQLVHGRFAVLQDKYAAGMGRTEDPFHAQFPGAEDTILRLSGADHGQAQQPAQSSAQQPRAINPQTGHAIIWNGSAWVPE